MKTTKIAMAAGAVLTALGTAPAAGAADFASDRITVTASGEGPDVVLIPGLTSSPEIWADTAAAIPGYRYHFVQLSGFAGAPPTGNANGQVVSASAAEIARYIKERGLKHPAVIGHSMGGTLGMMVAARNPDLVDRLMVVDMVPFAGIFFGPPGTTADSVRATADMVKTNLLTQSDDAHVKSIEANIATMVTDPAKRAAPVRHGVTSDRDVSARAMHELITTDLRGELGQYKGKLTVLYVKQPTVPITAGQFDAVYKLSYAAAPQAALKRIDDSLHFIMFDQPERFRDEVRAFLN
ncbi:alpha/beta fold hydrolase [Allosphingosinicella vermicomposti]|uniref:alpha/beta fold hydrolase n=1 Tax=Allosphingosinicella vermicomposti TaxID=614671 RepID=UPI000D0FF25A|nr:alpha/beta hydrolase [Allosphingosinicella vermicomposti]